MQEYSLHFFTEFAQCCHARYEWEVNAPRIMCPECQNVYIGVRFGQWKFEEEGGRNFLFIVESKKKM